jgi:hypothetical protein
MELGGYFMDNETGRIQMPIVSNPSALDIDAIVAQFSSKNGVVCLRVKPTPDFGAYKLDLYADSGNYLLMLNQYLDDGDHEVSTITNHKAGMTMVEILGDLYPENSMTRDIDFICNRFKEFLESGNVSSESFVIGD